MKLQIETVAKEIKIAEKINLGKLIDKLEELLPDGLWKEYSINVGCFYNWDNPIIINNPISVPDKPFYVTCPTCSTTDAPPPPVNIFNISASLHGMPDTKTYNIEIK